MATAPNNESSRPVWDRFVRVFHWTLVSCVMLNFFVLEEGDDLHLWAGYVATGLVVARIAWGFFGSRHARFSDFFPTPARVLRHIRAVRAGEPEHHWGHNPLGALMILALISLVLSIGLTGWMQGTDTYFGEEWLQNLHRYLADGLMILVGLHASAALIMGRIERTRLIKAMITGTKERY